MLPERSTDLAAPATEFDSPWKEALEEYLEAFLALFFPAVHADIDWLLDSVALPGGQAAGLPQPAGGAGSE